MTSKFKFKSFKGKEDNESKDQSLTINTKSKEIELKKYNATFNPIQSNNLSYVPKVVEEPSLNKSVPTAKVTPLQPADMDKTITKISTSMTNSFTNNSSVFDDDEDLSDDFLPPPNVIKKTKPSISNTSVATKRPISTKAMYGSKSSTPQTPVRMPYTPNSNIFKPTQKSPMSIVTSTPKPRTTTKSKPSTPFTPVSQKSIDTVVISKKFYGLVEELLEFVGSMSTTKLMDCFEDKIGLVTGLLKERKNQPIGPTSMLDHTISQVIERSALSRSSVSMDMEKSVISQSSLTNVVDDDDEDIEDIDFDGVFTDNEQVPDSIEDQYVALQTYKPRDEILDTFHKLSNQQNAPIVLNKPLKDGADLNGEQFVSLTDKASKWDLPAEELNSKHHRDDADKFNGDNYEHTTKMYNAFSNVFGLQSFRMNQREAINSILLGEDTFVLMPTGGGKSLCYQLPAVVQEGLTVVISPLKSLIQDQVLKLRSLGINAQSLSGAQKMDELNSIFLMLDMPNPEIKLLYVCPEKIMASDRLMQIFVNLYQRKRLEMFVIDEAHCVSQWGHDFRPDYRSLKMLRERFIGVPMLALTATATTKVRQDILNQMQMNHANWFIQSFNRPNLRWEVQPKQGKALHVKHIIKTIKAQFAGQSGIVYCFSRNECEEVAKELKCAGLQAEHYHAGMSDAARNSVQEKWLSERGCKIICATIAFGMGIDKPDVRFVMHHTVPKSIEGYYQESGRAGRDGMPATCILFYSWGDINRVKKLIYIDKGGNIEIKKQHELQLYKMASFCENTIDCRRTQVLSHFGEHFDRKQCGEVRGSLCDCCEKGEFTRAEKVDVTEHAIMLVKAVMRLSADVTGCTLTHMVDFFRGSTVAKIVNSGHDKIVGYGQGRSYSRSDAERLLRLLVTDGYLYEKICSNQQDFLYTRLFPGARHQLLLINQVTDRIILPISRNKTAVAGYRKDEMPSNLDLDSRQNMQLKCYRELVGLTQKLATANHMTNYANLFSNAALMELSKKLPENAVELRTIPNFPAKKIELYGTQYLEITQRYAAQLKQFIQDQKNKESALCIDVGPSGSSSTFANSSAYIGQKRKSTFAQFSKAKKYKKSSPKKKLTTRKKGLQRSCFNLNLYDLLTKCRNSNLLKLMKVTAKGF